MTEAEKLAQKIENLVCDALDMNQSIQEQKEVVRKICEDFIHSVVPHRDFEVICDATNNSPESIGDGRINISRLYTSQDFP